MGEDRYLHSGIVSWARMLASARETEDAEFGARNPVGALLYRQISAYNTQARPNIRDDSVYVSADQAKATGVPFHMLSSDLDPLFPPEVLQAVAADIDAPMTHVEGAGHSTYFEMPDEFNAALRAFLNR